MIQRIQTLYLLLAAAALVWSMCCPWATFFGPDGSVFTLEAFALTETLGEGSGTAFWALGALAGVAAFLSLTAIFLFRKRLVQVRLCFFNLMVLVGLYLCFLVFFFITKSRLEAGFGVNFGLALPLVAAVLDVMAMNAILKDEKRVRAYERIR